MIVYAVDSFWVFILRAPPVFCSVYRWTSFLHTVEIMCPTRGIFIWGFPFVLSPCLLCTFILSITYCVWLAPPSVYSVLTHTKDSTVRWAVCVHACVFRSQMAVVYAYKCIKRLRKSKFKSIINCLSTWQGYKRFRFTCLHHSEFQALNLENSYFPQVKTSETWFCPSACWTKWKLSVISYHFILQKKLS